MMVVSMTKLYDIYNNLLKQKADGATTASGILSKLGINMEDYFQHREYADLVIEQRFKEKQIKIKLPYETKNEGGYIPRQIIKQYYEPKTYEKGFELQNNIFHDIEIEVDIQVKEYVVDLDKILREIERELRGKVMVAQYDYSQYCEKIKDLEKKKKRIFNKLAYCKDFNNEVMKIKL